MIYTAKSQATFKLSVGTFAAIKLSGKRVDKMILKAPAAMKIAFGENPKGCY